MRRAAAIILRIPWLLGLIVGMVISLLRWGWMAAADGAELAGKWVWAPAAGALLVAGLVVWMVV